MSKDSQKGKSVNKAHKVEEATLHTNNNGAIEDAEIAFIGAEEDDSTSTSDQASSDGGELEALKAELAKAKNDFLYLQAEYENHRRQAIKERSDLLKYGSEHLVRDLLNVFDIFEMALQTEVTPENFNQFQEGVVMTSKEFQHCLERHNIRQIDSIGKPFDPQLHEALSSEETDSVEPGFIYRVHKEAFKMHDRIIRPAQVVVAKKPSSVETEDGQ